MFIIQALHGLLFKLFITVCLVTPNFIGTVLIYILVYILVCMESKLQYRWSLHFLARYFNVYVVHILFLCS